MGPQKLIQLYQSVKKLPAGSKLINLAIGRFIPYSGSIYPEIMELGAGRCVVQIKDRRAVRNHLDCVHAAALMNLSEIASGLAMLSALPPTMRGIVKTFTVEYFKKARGTLRAESSYTGEFKESESQEVRVEALVKNKAGEVVCRGEALWKIGPNK